ncbi:D-2-hydroxyacid dehydrogenase Ddh [Gottschalkia purinilytica]|uniref:D-2-hydroxyacid dehydrogenase Ddh n=1 Tax=Gottschalkia purinilytica TaxID=1503 RepID=A0A0L0WC07_GOTPU|nr:D-2-hydroxyacid dehydrogenase [Gottschalkia purinilytica]KNF09011.1 D-2-hydroxyacid dehydrogenase Ddh [Gottschalkia purinilytica]
MYKIAILDAKTLGEDIDLSCFNKFGEVKLYETTSREEIFERTKDVDVVLTNKVILDKEVISKAKNLKLICITATGINNVDTEYAKERNIAVTNVAGYSTKSVVQHTFAMLFYLAHSLKYYDEYVKNGEYSNSPIFTNISRVYYELENKTWGIIGLGEIGRGVAKVAESFGAKVVYYSTSGRNTSSSYERKDLDELLSISDVVSIHCPLNSKTENLITLEKIKMMKKSAFLINAARGKIINEKDLSVALDEDLIMGACLDVLEKEPIDKENPLLRIKNKDKLLITPHIAWASFEARVKLINEVNLNIEAFVKGEKRNRVE